MKYQIKQKIFSLSDSYTIKNEYGEDVYSVTGKIFSLGKKLYIHDLNGNELVYIEQKLFKLLPQFTLFIDDKEVAVIRKEFSFFTPKFTIECLTNNYSMEGDILSHEFNILKDNNIIGTVTKAWFSFSDTYGVEIAGDENQALILAFVIVMDEVQHNNKDNS